MKVLKNDANDHDNIIYIIFNISEVTSNHIICILIHVRNVGVKNNYNDPACFFLFFWSLRGYI